jgi:hypothetical protein
MQGTVAQTFLYPIKGMQGVEMTTKGLMTDPELGVYGDRNHAIYRRPNNPPTEWAPKGKFWVCMNREEMATPIGNGLNENDLDEDHEIVSGRYSPQTQFDHFYTETVHSLDISHISKSLAK